eukprot:m.30644 g.30644  ORF g.30644 m.30644 type:complete len:180 (+) comp9309_c0_seq1:1585-2124(+)
MHTHTHTQFLPSLFHRTLNHFLLLCTGSMNTDLPTLTLKHQLHVKHTIVSQLNPHVAPFIGSALDTKLLSIPLAILARCVQSIPLPDMAFLRLRSARDMLVGLVTQDYRGDITIAHKTFWYSASAIHNPTPEFIDIGDRLGQQVTWPNMANIQFQLRIERELEQLFEKWGLPSFVPAFT